MKSTFLISSCAITASAHDLWSSFSDSNVCVSTPSLFGGCPAGHGDNTELETRFNESREESAASLWPISTPCASNGSREFCIYSDPKFAGGRGISIFTSPKRAASLAQSSVFRDASVLGDIDRLNAQEHPKWQIQPVPGKDIGVIATQHFEVGDHIMSATPAMMEDYSVLRALSKDQILDLQARGIDHLPAGRRSTFLNLSTHDEVDSYVKRVDQVLHINAFDLDHVGDIPVDDNERGWFVVFPEISRFNHDCRPNANYYFDPVTLTQHVHAVRHISPGEEITISYIDTVMTQQQRQQRIQKAWHFACSCSLCTMNSDQTAASDARIKQIQELQSHLEDYSPSSLATPLMGELLVSLYEQEHLWSSIFEAHTLAAIEHNGAGEPWLATKHASLAVQYGLASSGPDDNDVVEMKSLAKDPWNHWSWMLRSKKPTSWGSKRTV